RWAVATHRRCRRPRLTQLPASAGGARAFVSRKRNAEGRAGSAGALRAGFAEPDLRAEAGRGGAQDLACRRAALLRPAAARLRLVGLADDDGPAVEEPAVQGGERVPGLLGTVELDEGEAAALPRLEVGHHANAGHQAAVAAVAKEGPEHALVGVVRQVAHIKL